MIRIARRPNQCNRSKNLIRIDTRSQYSHTMNFDFLTRNSPQPFLIRENLLLKIIVIEC